VTVREVRKKIVGQETYDGAGVKLVRILGPGDIEDIDPFLLLDIFDNEDPEDYIKGFPMHPHRGIETITYLIKGKVDHRDSMGNEGTINEGESQWMTAGSGILHEEMPQLSDRLFGFQTWLNLPKKDKMVEPEYLDIKKDMIKTISGENYRVKLISGTFKGVNGVNRKYTQADIMDIILNPNSGIEIPLSEELNSFIYIYEGEGKFGNENSPVENKTVALFSKGDKILAKAEKDGLRFILFAGKPIKENVAWGGPIVMNTDEELEEAFHELRAGSFIKH